MSATHWLLLALHVLCATATHLTPMPCSDKSVEKLALLAMTYINEDRQTGYKFALNRVFNVHVHPQGPAGKVYYLDLDVLETKCHVLSPKAWKRCDIRPFMETQISGSCNITILHTPDGFSYLHSYDCTLVPDPPEKLQKTCPDCPLLLPLDSEGAVSSAKTTLHRYNHQSTLPTTLTLAAITRASLQTSPAVATFVEYTVQECAVEPVGNALCVPAEAGKGPIGFCTGAVIGTGAVQTSVKVSCEIFHPQRIGNSRDVGTQQKTLAGQASPGASALLPDVPIPPFEDADAKALRLVEPVQQIISHDAAPLAPHPSHAPGSSDSSESSQDESSSSEEFVGSIRIARPPHDFHYSAFRQKRHAPGNSQLSPSPTFLAVFPGTPSPFRSCPGLSRYTTV